MNFKPGSIQPMLINGEFTKSVSGETFSVFDPATGEAIAEVAKGNAEDIDLAVKAARNAFAGPWSKLSASERGKILWKIGDLILENADALASLESLDNGKPEIVARVADIPLAADLFHYMAGWCTKIVGETFPISVPYAPGAEFHAFTEREPVGVIGQIIPWNFPLLMAAWKLGPALATGNTVILKPAEQTPLTALRLGELINPLLPPGVVNIVPGFGEAGAALAVHDDVDKVAFTGSTEVGRSIVQAAAGNLKKISLELGGKSPNIIFNDADLEKAIDGAANAIFFNHGQCCCAGSRLFIQRDIFDVVINGLRNRALATKLGRGSDPETQMGPLVSQEQYDRVTGYIEEGLADGACAVTGDYKVPNTSGYFVSPTVLTNVTSEMSVVREEIFGPVVVAEPFDTVEEVIERANDSEYGLAAGIWTTDLSKAHRVAKQLRAGTVWINTYNIFDAALPFGGYKQSGWGREMGKEALELYTETKAVVIGL